MYLIKILLILVLLLVFYEDISDKLVHWFLFPILGFLLGSLHKSSVEVSVFLVTIGINILLVSIVLLLLYGYSKLILRSRFLNKSFGLGDLLLFYALSIGFPTVTFAILFAFSIFFSLVIHLLINRLKKGKQTVPLAGYISFFYAMVFIGSFFDNVPSLYRY